MPPRTDRTVGESLTGSERELLEFLCSGDDEQSERARIQLRSARWGGYEHDGCECFLVRCSRDESTLVHHDGGPFSVAEVRDGEETVGHLEMWVVDGLLHSVTYMPFADHHDALPAARS